MGVYSELGLLACVLSVCPLYFIYGAGDAVLLRHVRAIR